ncbi:hypothetical protein C1H46_000678 [Malus baccata]|uniref:Uncharacterized protein n=1 Tax=Malus baccata TaxID=106549 RepID=A0A540NRM4_MALBA|nr:hypothetical protein C1H46_000678 [Malus baccata]
MTRLHQSGATLSLHSITEHNMAWSRIESGTPKQQPGKPRLQLSYRHKTIR